MPNEPINEDQLTPFSGELDFEDLEFLSNQQAEMMAGGMSFGVNVFPPGRSDLPPGLDESPPGWGKGKAPWKQ